MFDLFKEDIISKRLNEEQLFQKHFIDAETFFFRHFQNLIDLEYELKKEVADALKVHVNDVYIIGSGKTGFSIKPRARGRLFDQKYSETNKLKDKSDIDIAVVNSSLFDFIQENIYDWSNSYSENWDRNAFYDSGKDKFGVTLKYKFLEYLGKGWYRPDFAPQDYFVERSENINMLSIKNKWRKKLDRKIAFAFYKNWNFFKKYQMENISALKAEVELKLGVTPK